ncbi:MAG: ribosome maturation factor RimM [Gammaproteobacteria bacterium]|nr:ribosome maturation factor RimM [Gammaproteobacteria bacterium]MCZ6585877.1 ribosome maturation factor RimM [Gammaproteobacteria bacterium]TDJ27823.1 MAG: ribosome maturation factor RimM [Gammaproteobacteria bacterium]
MSGAPRKLVTLGRVNGLLGVKGWLKIYSYTDPRDSIVGFSTWVLRTGDDEQTVELEDGRKHGRTVVVKLKAIDDRDQAEALVGADIAVERDALAPCDPGEYYWTDLEGSTVVTAQGESLGRLDHLFETGGHDVMVVIGDRRRLIPFVQEKVVREVRLEQHIIVVDWDPTF